MTGLKWLITGGTGSLGHALVRFLLKSYEPARIVIYSRDELKQSEMRRQIPDIRLDFFLGDVRDLVRLQWAFDVQPDVVIHAAALKQVPACEQNPWEAIQTNVVGAQNVVFAAIEHEIPRVIGVSSDKAVAPLNVYGKTKALAESIFVRGNAWAGRRSTRFSVVRYGNVIGSRGSVIPLFLQQRSDGKLMVTDRRMTRFWIPLERRQQDDATWTAPEFIIWALGIMKGGEIFIPKLPSARMSDIGAAIAPDCEMVETGMRPGEKLHELMVSVDEGPQTIEMSDFNDAYVILPTNPTWSFTAPIGSRVPDDFSYSSNDSPLAVEYLEVQ